MALLQEGENFVKLSFILFDIGARHLRQLFKKMWDEKYPNQKWNSDDASGDYLYNELSSDFTRSRSKQMYIEKWRKGKDHEWDTTTLVKVMLESGLNLVKGCRPEGERTKPLRTSEEINIIRNIRNDFFAHLPTMSCPSDDYTRVIADIKRTAKNLFGEEAEHEIHKIESSPVGEDIIGQVEQLLKDIVKDFENDLNGN